MPKFYGQNKKRIDPRYFLDETTDRDVHEGLFGFGQPEEVAFEYCTAALARAFEKTNDMDAAWGIVQTSAASCFNDAWEEEDDGNLILTRIGKEIEAASKQAFARWSPNFPRKT